MRQQLGLTQAELATKLKVALSTIGRWESWDPPKGHSLDRLIRFAELNKLPIAASLRHEREQADEQSHAQWFRLHTDEEAKYVRVTLLILRDPLFAEVRPKLCQFMTDVLNAPDFTEGSS